MQFGSLRVSPDVLQDISIEAELHKERLTTHFNGQGLGTVFEPDRITVQTENGRLLDSREDPRSAFRGHTRETPGDGMHVAYLSSYALSNYLTIPFRYTYSGFVTEELAPWQENGEEWQPLRVIVPDYIASHSHEQVAYFDPDGLLRRHEYTVDVIAGASGSPTPLTIVTSTELSRLRNAEYMQPTPTNKRLRSPCGWLSAAVTFRSAPI